MTLNILVTKGEKLFNTFTAHLLFNDGSTSDIERSNWYKTLMARNGVICWVCTKSSNASARACPAALFL